MRRVRRRAAGPAHDAEGGGGDEQPRGRPKRGDPALAGLRQGQAAAVQIPARGDLHRRTAEDRHGEDRPAGAAKDVARGRTTRSEIVGWAKRSVPTIAYWKRDRGHGASRLCPSYETAAEAMRCGPLTVVPAKAGTTAENDASMRATPHPPFPR